MSARTHTHTYIYIITIVSKCRNSHTGGVTYQIFEYSFGTCLDEYIAEWFHFLHAHGVVQRCSLQLEDRHFWILTAIYIEFTIL
jgi:hypothetical protein